MEIIFKEKPLSKTGVEITAQKNGQEVGSIILSKRDGRALVGYIGVKTGFENNNLGNELLEEGLNWANEQNCTEIGGTLTPKPGSEGKILKMIKKRGFKIDKKGNARKKLGQN